MIAQVVPLYAAERWLEYDTYVELGWRGVIFAVLVGSIIFGVIKHHIGFRNIGPNEGGIRELFGIKLWKLRPGPHFYITGFSNVRKAPLAVSQIDLVGEAQRQGFIFQFRLAVFIQVLNTRKALIARIYFAEDNNKSDMENGENIKQITTILMRSARQLIESGVSPSVIEAEMRRAKKKRLERDYGSHILDALVTELVPRPLSEVAGAMRGVPLPAATVIGALVGDDSLTGNRPAHLEAIEGGVGAS